MIEDVSATQPGHDKDYKSHAPHAIAKRTHERKPDDLSLNCNDAKKTHTLSALLAALNPSEPHTIRVSGACTDNISIVNFAQITLLAESGASVTDASGGLLPVIDVERTRPNGCVRRPQLVLLFWQHLPGFGGRGSLRGSLRSRFSW